VTAIRDLLAAGPTLSFEFSPPRTPEATEKLRSTLAVLAPWAPDFVSVTYGAGGSTRDTTRDIVVEIDGAHPFPCMPHLTCVGHSRDEISSLLDDYEDHGIANVLALAGDPQPELDDPGHYRFALDLVREVRNRGDMSIGVAAFPEVHPRSESSAADRRHLAEKLTAADFGITQFFFDVDHYTRMVTELAELGCTTPVLPGVVPVVNPATIRRFAAMNGTAVDERLFARLESVEAGPERLTIAADAAAAQIEQLLDAGAPGIHLYTMNQPEAAVAVLERTGLRHSR